MHREGAETAPFSTLPCTRRSLRGHPRADEDIRAPVVAGRMPHSSSTFGVDPLAASSPSTFVCNRTRDCWRRRRHGLGRTSPDGTRALGASFHCSSAFEFLVDGCSDGGARRAASGHDVVDIRHDRVDVAGRPHDDVLEGQHGRVRLRLACDADRSFPRRAYLRRPGREPGRLCSHGCYLDHYRCDSGSTPADGHHRFGTGESDNLDVGDA